MYLVKKDDYRQIANEQKRNNYSTALVEEIIKAVDIIDFIEEEYGIYPSSVANGWYRYNCILPGHRDSSPSFGVLQEKQIYNCFGCNRSGNVVQLIREMEGLNFYESVSKLSIIVGITDDDGTLEIQRTIRTVNKDVEDFLNHSAETDLPAGVSENQFMLMVATRLRGLEKSLEYNCDVLKFTDSIYQEFDSFWDKQNHKNMSKLWSSLSSRIKSEIKLK